MFERNCEKHHNMFRFKCIVVVYDMLQLSWLWLLICLFQTDWFNAHQRLCEEKIQVIYHKCGHLAPGIWHLASVWHLVVALLRNHISSSRRSTKSSLQPLHIQEDLMSNNHLQCHRNLTDQTWFFFIKTESHNPNLPVKRSLIGIVGHVTSIDETSAGSQPPKRDSPVIVGLWAEFRWKSPLQGGLWKYNTGKRLYCNVLPDHLRICPTPNAPNPPGMA